MMRQRVDRFTKPRRGDLQRSSLSSPTVVAQAKRSLQDEEDVHARLMSVYPEVSQFWYLGIFVANFALGAVAVSCWPTELPIWAYLVSLFIAFSFTLAIGIVQATTNQQIA